MASLALAAALSGQGWLGAGRVDANRDVADCGGAAGCWKRSPAGPPPRTAPQPAGVLTAWREVGDPPREVALPVRLTRPW